MKNLHVYSVSGMVVINVPIEQVRIPRDSVRKIEKDSLHYKELAADILEHGVKRPLIVRKVRNRYYVKDGRYRLLAAKDAGLETIPVCVQN